MTRADFLLLIFCIPQTCADKLEAKDIEIAALKEELAQERDINAQALAQGEITRAFQAQEEWLMEQRRLCK